LHEPATLSGVQAHHLVVPPVQVEAQKKDLLPELLFASCCAEKKPVRSSVV
jgi:hypothetical protein